jgi:myo-inositol-1(or 4)-monophosphatase
MIDLYRASRAAEQAAYAAGTHLQASRSRLSATMVTHEEPSDVVHAIDDEVRVLIRDVVLRQFPQHDFQCERHSVAAPAVRLSERPTWIIDPLNGLTNYRRGYPQYAVSIALVQAGEPLVGVIYDPSRNEFFGAIHGQGAVLNGQQIRCSRPRAPIDSLAATVFPKPSSPRMPTYVAEFGRVVRGFHGVRRSGSMALELAYLSASRIDAFWEHDVGGWEFAAGILLLRESGALIHARDGRPLLASESLLACAPHLFESFLSMLAEE